MADFAELFGVMQEISSNANSAGCPVTVCFGTVTSEAPLKILVDQKLQIGEAQIILTRNVTDFENEQTAHSHLTENRGGGGGHAAFESHNHVYTGRKPFTMHHKLITGDKVLLIREQGGQRYIVIDRGVM